MRRENPVIGWLARWRARWVMALLALAVALSAPDAERIGDRLQIALPVAALGCAVATGGVGDYLLRLAVLEVGIHGTKAALGELELNRRPNGGGRGFPSGHTAAASFGAVRLVQHCVSASPLVQGAVLLAAAFTGASRIEAGAHDIWQVLAGALWGWLVAAAGWRRKRRRAAGG